MIFLPKCRPFYVVLEKGHGAGEKGMVLEKRAWRGAMLKLAWGNTTPNSSCSLTILRKTCNPENKLTFLLESQMILT